MTGGRVDFFNQAPKPILLDMPKDTGVEQPVLLDMSNYTDGQFFVQATVRYPIILSFENYRLYKNVQKFFLAHSLQFQFRILNTQCSFFIMNVERARDYIILDRISNEIGNIYSEIIFICHYANRISNIAWYFQFFFGDWLMKFFQNFFYDFFKRDFFDRAVSIFFAELDQRIDDIVEVFRLLLDFLKHFFFSIQIFHATASHILSRIFECSLESESDVCAYTTRKKMTSRILRAEGSEMCQSQTTAPAGEKNF